VVPEQCARVVAQASAVEAVIGVPVDDQLRIGAAATTAMRSGSTKGRPTKNAKPPYASITLSIAGVSPEQDIWMPRV
jgi:hypothetical protein